MKLPEMKDIPPPPPPKHHSYVVTLAVRHDDGRVRVHQNIMRATSAYEALGEFVWDTLLPGRKWAVLDVQSFDLDIEKETKEGDR